MQTDTPHIRLAELMAALSLATDLGKGQPLEYTLQVCLLSVRLGDALGLSVLDLREIYYLALLRYIGCNAETSTIAALFGDELAIRRELASVDRTNTPQLINVIIRTIYQTHQGTPPLDLLRTIAQTILTAPHVMKEEYRGFCEVAQRLALRLGFRENILLALGQVFQRWDGRGVAGEIKGEDIALSVRVVGLAQDAITFHRLGGIEAAYAVAQERKGKAYDPAIVECFCEKAAHLLAGLEEDPSWEAVIAMEPGSPLSLSGDQFDAACRAIADFADIKSSYTLGHSSGVAALAADAARHCGLSEADIVMIRRAGLLHDVGRVGISAGIWGKLGPLSDRERERVRLHPYYTERVLARPSALAELGALASLHHERLDGSGYHRGLSANMLSPAARILAAADVYHAMTEPRPHRPAYTPEAAAEEVLREVRAGRLDGEAVNGVLAAAGHRIGSSRRESVAGLSQRELEVLRLIARGQTIKQMAGTLILSQKTIDNHIQHIYSKIGVSTRAGATLFAMEHDLIMPQG
jgi:HD-GYP domain-containing protein (c-di-GMP phosphodiesterase class II)